MPGYEPASMRPSEFDKILHHLWVAHGVDADGFLQGDAHKQLFHGHFQFFAVEGAWDFVYGNNLIGDVMRRKIGANPGAYAGFEGIIHFEARLEDHKERDIVGSASTLDADNQAVD